MLIGAASSRNLSRAASFEGDEFTKLHGCYCWRSGHSTRSVSRTQRPGRPGVPHLHPRARTPHDGECLRWSTSKNANMTLRAQQATRSATSSTKHYQLPFGPCWVESSCALKHLIYPPSARTPLDMAKGMPSNWARLGIYQGIFSPVKAARIAGVTVDRCCNRNTLALDSCVRPGSKRQ
jgi:hypothetical protein